MYAWFRGWATLLVLVVQTFANVGLAEQQWQSLRDRNPFVPPAPPAPLVEPAPPQLELRGVMVEGRVTWFNLYNAETKESAWVKRGDQLADYMIKDYETERETLVLDYRKKAVSVALKPLKMQRSAGSARSGVAVALSSSAPHPASFSQGKPLEEGERLDQVAEQIRQRREERRRQTSQSSQT